MNLRILKKLSKRAAPLLPLIGDDRKQFRAAKGESYTSLLIWDRTDFERGRSTHADLLRQGEIKRPAKDGRGFVYMHPPSHPRKGTVMVGAMSGYYEPEWDEETAWESLRERVWWHFMDWTDEGEPIEPTRPLETVADYFAAAAAIAQEVAVKEAERMAARAFRSFCNAPGARCDTLAECYAEKQCRHQPEEEAAA